MRFCTLCTIFVAHVASVQPLPLNQISHGGTARALPWKRELVEAAIFGQEAIATVRFELVSESGQLSSMVPAFRFGDGADAD
jgi:hypothetical protein